MFLDHSKHHALGSVIDHWFIFLPLLSITASAYFKTSIVTFSF